MSEAFCAAEGYGVALFDIDGEMPFDGWHGSMKPEGRRRWTMAGGYGSGRRVQSARKCLRVNPQPVAVWYALSGGLLQWPKRHAKFDPGDSLIVSEVGPWAI